MNRDSKVVKFAIIVLALTMIALILVSGTYAKYTSSASATTTARVAKWDILLNGKNIDEVQTVDIDLFNTILEDDGSAEESAEDVKKGTAAEKIIAPGTSGEFALKLKNQSEVKAEYSMTFSLTNSNNIPLEFSSDNGETWTKDITTFKVGDPAPTVLAQGAETTELKIKWRWAFTGTQSQNYQEGTGAQTDATDTALGKAGTATAVVTATVNVNQVN